jgi:hypothetical protein
MALLNFNLLSYFEKNNRAIKLIFSNINSFFFCFYFHNNKKEKWFIAKLTLLFFLIISRNFLIYSFLYKIFIILIRACPLATLGVGLRFQVRGRKPWGRKAAKRASKVAFLPPRPQRLPPLRAFHLRPHARQLTRAEPFKLKMKSGKKKDKKWGMNILTFLLNSR